MEYKEMALVKRNLALLQQAYKGAIRIGDIRTAKEIEEEIAEITKFYMGKEMERWVN